MRTNIIIKAYRKLAIKSPILPIIFILILLSSTLYFASKTYVGTYDTFSAAVDNNNLMVVELKQNKYKDISLKSKVLWYLDKSKNTYSGQVTKLESKNNKSYIYIKSILGVDELKTKKKVTVEIETGRENIFKKLLDR